MIYITIKLNFIFLVFSLERIGIQRKRNNSFSWAILLIIDGNFVNLSSIWYHLRKYPSTILMRKPIHIAHLYHKKNSNNSLQAELLKYGDKLEKVLYEHILIYLDMSSAQGRRLLEIQKNCFAPTPWQNLIKPLAWETQFNLWGKTWTLSVRF